MYTNYTPCIGITNNISVLGVDNIYIYISHHRGMFLQSCVLMT